MEQIYLENAGKLLDLKHNSLFPLRRTRNAETFSRESANAIALDTGRMLNAVARASAEIPSWAITVVLAESLTPMASEGLMI